MIIPLSNIPNWLKNGDKYLLFLENANGDDTQETYVPKKYLKDTDDIFSIKDFQKIYEICKFWLIKYPNSFYNYAFENKKEVMKLFYREYDDAETEFLIEELNKSEKIEYKLIPFMYGGIPVCSLTLKSETNNSFIFNFEVRDNRFVSDFSGNFLKLSNCIKNKLNYENNNLQSINNKLIFTSNNFQHYDGLNIEYFKAFIFNIKITDFNRNNLEKIFLEIHRNINLQVKFFSDGKFLEKKFISFEDFEKEINNFLGDNQLF